MIEPEIQSVGEEEYEKILSLGMFYSAISINYIKSNYIILNL